MKKYFGSFTDRDNVAGEFGQVPCKWGTTDEERIPNADFPTEDEILFASYENQDYDGDAFVLFRKDGKLYEVHGSHCSCYGLEECWQPEETTVEALAERGKQDPAKYYWFLSSHGQEVVDAYWELIGTL
jgi:hypothetical protein